MVPAWLGSSSPIAGVAPGERAVVEIRPYTEDEWVAEAEGKVLSSDEFIDHLRRAPGTQ